MQNESNVVVTIEKAVFESGSLARHDGMVLFVEGALAGERVEVDIVERKRRYARARLGQVLEASPHRVEPSCPVYARCGGCRLQHADYGEQVAIKEGFLREALYFVPELERVLRPLHPSPRPFHFRNKMDFTVIRHEGNVTIGLHEKGQHEAMVSAECCLLQSEESNALRRGLRETLEAWPAAREPGRRAAFPERLTIRESRDSGEQMLAVRMTARDRALEQRIAEAAEPWCATILFTVTDPGRPMAPPAWRVARGAGVLFEKLGDWTFEIGPDTFFQTHTEQAEFLFRRIAEHVQAVAPSRVGEWYAGTGALTHFLAGPGREVVALESSRASVEAARRNLKRHALTGVEMIRAEVEAWTPPPGAPPFDLVVVDPPRAGLTPQALRRLLEERPAHIVYMSCHPATLGRDLRALLDAGYAVEWIQPADMFPQSDHVETVVALRR